MTNDIHTGIRFTYPPYSLILYCIFQIGIGIVFFYFSLSVTLLDINSDEIPTVLVKLIAMISVILFSITLYVARHMYSITLQDNNLVVTHLYAGNTQVELNSDFRIRRSLIFTFLMRLDIDGKKYYYIPKRGAINLLKQHALNWDDTYKLAKEFIYHL